MGERKELAEEIGRSGLADGLLDSKRRMGDNCDEVAVGRAITRWERLASELR
jgi:hypothetical protein